MAQRYMSTAAKFGAKVENDFKFGTDRSLRSGFVYAVQAEVERRIAAGEIIGAWPPSHRQRTRWRVTGAVPAEPTWSGRRVACPAAGRHQQPPRHGGWRSEKLSRLGRLSISVRQVPHRRRPMYSMHRVVRPYQHPPGLTQWKQRANVPRRINPQMTRGMPSGVVPLANFRTVEAAAR